MKRRLAWVLVIALLPLVIVSGCSGNRDYTARFVRYETLQDGTRVAVLDVSDSGANPSQQEASTTLSDLKAEEMVVVQDNGRGWDLPQWKPSAVIVQRAAAGK